MSRVEYRHVIYRSNLGLLEPKRFKDDNHSITEDTPLQKTRNSTDLTRRD